MDEFRLPEGSDNGNQNGNGMPSPEELKEMGEAIKHLKAEGGPEWERFKAIMGEHTAPASSPEGENWLRKQLGDKPVPLLGEGHTVASYTAMVGGATDSRLQNLKMFMGMFLVSGYPKKGYYATLATTYRRKLRIIKAELRARGEAAKRAQAA